MPAPLFSDWSPAARAVVERACATYGGRDRWSRTELSFSVRVLRGLVPKLKGVGVTFSLPGRIHVVPSAARARFDDYPRPGEQGLYEAGAVSLIGADQRATSRDLALRESFRGWHRLARWRPRDALYFFGYALTHYHAVPFTLGEARLLGHARRGGLDRLTLELPATLHTHCRRQTFYLDDEGLIRRHDYVADIVGPWARGAHFWRNDVRIAGFPFARTRHVVVRLGLCLPVTALHAELDDVAVLVGDPPSTRT